MQIPPGSLNAPSLSAWGKQRPGGAASVPASQKAAGRETEVKKQMQQQDEKHLSFLLRAREGMALFEERLKELNGFIEKHGHFTQEDIAQQVVDARGLLQGTMESITQLREAIDNEREEHTFVMSTLEAMLADGGSFPTTTLEEYLKKKEAEEEGEERRVPSYTTASLDRMIDVQRAKMGRGSLPSHA